MASLKVFDKSGQEVGVYDINTDEIASSINRQLLHNVVVMYQSNQRQGTAASKSRAMVAGSTKKMYRQKGTGNARAGSRRSGIRRGGGHIFAKSPRDWTYRLPKKAIRLATRMAFASKLIDDQVVLVNDLDFDSPKTKDMAAILRALSLDGKSLTVATADLNANIYKSARNIQRVNVSPVRDLNALSILTPQKLLLTPAALDAFREFIKPSQVALQAG